MHQASFDGQVLTVRIPMRLHRQRGRKRIVAPDGAELTPASPPQPDGALVKALARAWRWQRLLDQGVYRSITDIAQAENLNKSYVSRILRLALLAPDIVEAILEGTADNEVTLRTLKEGVSLDWKEQLPGRARIDVLSPNGPLANPLAVPDPDRPMQA